MNFSAWAIRNPIAPLLAFAMLLFVGIQSFYSLPITRFPNIDVPVVAITVAQSGASPSELEQQVTKEIEDAVAGITGVDDIQSSITDGVSQTTVIFRLEKPTQEAVQDVKDAIDKIRSNLPGDIEAPIVSKIDVEGQAIQTFAVSSKNMTLEELSWFVDDTVKREMQGEAGIGKVDRYGGAQREIHIELDPKKLDSYGVTAASVSAQLRQVNTNLGSGRSEISGNEQAIRTLGDAQSVETLKNTVISLPNGRFVRLSELGTVTDTYEELRSFSRYNGDQVVTFAVFRSKGASEVTVARNVEQVIERLREEHPQISIDLVSDLVFITEGNYHSAISAMMEGALLAIIVVFLFLRNWRATLISAVALPLSAIPTFWVMDMIGFSLNLVSFLAITLATGILVDDAIVEIENIARHIRMGKSPYRAALEAADEIGLAVIATSFTIIAVFVPVSFMGGIPGQYFIQFGLTVAIAVFFSLAVARLITPLMAAYIMTPADIGHDEDGKDGFLKRGYVKLVGFTLRVRYLTVLFAFGTLAVSLYFMAQVPGSFIPPDDVSRITASIELPPGSTLEDTDLATEKMRKIAQDIEGVESVFVLGGATPKGELDVRRATMTLVLEKREHSLYKRAVNILAGLVPYAGDSLKIPPDGRARAQWDIEEELFNKLASIPDVRAVKLNDRNERDLAYNILSPSEQDLNKAVAIIEANLRNEPLLTGVSSDGALPRPEIQVVPRTDEAARLGVTTAQIAQTVRVATLGDADAALAKVSLDDRQIPIRVQMNETVRNDLNRIRDLKVMTSSGTTVPLSVVADVRISQGPSVIKRLDRERNAQIGASLPPGVPLDSARERLEEVVAGLQDQFPPSVEFVKSGDAKVQNEMMQSFQNAMLMGLFLVLTVLILLFKDVIQPLTILLSLPLAIGGVAAALLLTGNPLSMPVLIGILMLMGIVTKNAILLIDFAIEQRRKGMERFEAIIDAGRKRAQPIIMTSIAMSAGMLPSALGVGEGGTFRAPMAIAVIGGIIVSTVLSLVIVPSFYLVMDDISRFMSWIFGRFIGSSEEEIEPWDDRQLTEEAIAARKRLGELAGRLDEMEDGMREAGISPDHPRWSKAAE